MLAGVRAVARRLTLDRQLDFWMQELAPRPRARIVAVQNETHDLATLALEPSDTWPGKDQRAGQFVTVGVEIDGVRFQRCYSLSSAPDKAPTITVKRVGKVSSWLHANLGATVELGKPQGQFVVPPTARKLLLLTGGSGISPAMAILREGRRDDVVVVHAARSQRDVPFVDELRTAGAILFLDDVTGQLDRDRLRAAVPDLHLRTTMLCGPAPMMDALLPAWEAMPEKLVLERFVPARPTGTRTVARTSQPRLTLLEALEDTGERPASGCRKGICNTCVCRKQSGIVENIVTGVRSHAGEEDIHLCVSRAVTDVEIAR